MLRFALGFGAESFNLMPREGLGEAGLLVLAALNQNFECFALGRLLRYAPGGREPVALVFWVCP